MLTGNRNLGPEVNGTGGLETKHINGVADQRKKCHLW